MIETLGQSLFGAIYEPVTFLTNPNKRLFWGYLLSGVLCFIGFALLTKIQWRRILGGSLRMRYWLGRNGRLDLQWITLNQVLALLLLSPLLMGQVAWAMANYRFLTATFGAGDFWHWSPSYVVLLFTLAMFIAEDFSRFLVHYCYHKIPLLWRFHAIHHSAKVMTPLTLYRIHFVEYCINSGRAVLVTGSVSGLFIYCFVGAIGVYEVLGVSVLNMLFNLFGANLRHSHTWLPFGRAEHLFISPAMHQIHHSSAKQHLDKNFGASLAIWDKLFGCWVPSRHQQVPRFGLYKQGNRQNLRKQLWGIPGAPRPAKSAAGSQPSLSNRLESDLIER